MGNSPSKHQISAKSSPSIKSEKTLSNLVDFSLQDVLERKKFDAPVGRV
jgi:hypothetical protein